MTKKKILILVILFIISGLIIYFFLPKNGYLYGNNGKLYISEILANNLFTIKDDDNEYSDYIELYNGYDFDINLKDYYLSDKEFETNIYKLPNITIKSKEYLIIFASGKNKYDEEKRIIHTNFRLSSKGEVITLTDKEGNIISKVKYLETKNDTSFGYKNKNYVYYYEPSPGAKNKGKTSNNPITNSKEKVALKINEYMTNNDRANYDREGDYSSWVEIFNDSDKDINLEKMFLSDNVGEINKWTFPKVTIKSKDYLLIYLSGKDKYDEEIHTNFKLSDNDTYLILSNSDGSEIDKVKLITLKDNVSYGLYEDKWCYYVSASPGKENSKNCFTSLGGN